MLSFHVFTMLNSLSCYMATPCPTTENVVTIEYMACCGHFELVKGTGVGNAIFQYLCKHTISEVMYLYAFSWV